MSKILLFNNLDILLNGHLFARRYRMTYVISIEVIIFAFLLVTIRPDVHHWSIIILSYIGIISAIINLITLKIYKCVRFSSYFFTSLFFLVASVGNFVAGGIHSSYFIWIYLAPIIAATLIGFRGLIIFGGLSILNVFAFLLLPHAPIFHPTPSQTWYIELMNYSFVMMLILSVLMAFLLEIYYFEKKTIAQQKALEAEREQLRHLSCHDMLTKLPNRKYFYEELHQKIDDGKSITIFYMDLNDFKNVNDQYGHEAGDQILIETSKRISNCFRNEDFLARVGGDEFIGVISYCKEIGFYKNVEQRIRDTFNFPYRSIKAGIRLNIAIGIAQYPLDANDAESLIALADKRMYEDKLKMKENL